MEDTARWLNWQRAAGIAPTTLVERQRVLTRFGEWLGAEPTHASTDDITEWFSRHYAAWAPSTKSSYYGHLRSYYRWLVLMDLRTDDPMVKIPVPRCHAQSPALFPTSTCHGSSRQRTGVAPER